MHIELLIRFNRLRGLMTHENKQDAELAIQALRERRADMADLLELEAMLNSYDIYSLVAQDRNHSRL